MSVKAVNILDESLFPDEVPVAAPPPKTRGARLRTRQAAVMHVGYHPLGPRLHEAVTVVVVVPAGGGIAKANVLSGPTCGSCVHRTGACRGTAGTYVKCDHPSTRTTSGEATDCRAWWPACTYHEVHTGVSS